MRFSFHPPYPKALNSAAKELTDAVRWAKSDLELFAPTVELHRLSRENSKDETEYKRFVEMCIRDRFPAQLSLPSVPPPLVSRYAVLPAPEVPSCAPVSNPSSSHRNR